jgi:predicted MFS family arabinose efflux permease
MAQIPVAALLNVLVAHGVGSFAGGWLSMRIAFKKNFIPPVTVGVLLTVIGIANLLFLPHPLWFTLVDVFLYLPAAYIGAKVAARKAE